MPTPAHFYAAWIATLMGRPDKAMWILLSASLPKKPQLRVVAWHGHRINENGFQEK